MSDDPRAELGRAGEKSAVRFLRRKRYRIVARNYRCPMGEIDIVALDGATIVFVEVKTRSDREYADPQDAVNAAKQRRLVRAAKVFLQHTRSQGRACRFDIVAVTLDGQKAYEIEHFVNAFVPCS